MPYYTTTPGYQPEEIKDEDAVKVWTVAVGNLPAPWQVTKIKGAKRAVRYIQKQDGFLGVHPLPPRGTLCLFETENDAKRARNNMRMRGIECGSNIGECFIDRKYLRR